MTLITYNTSVYSGKNYSMINVLVSGQLVDITQLLDKMIKISNIKLLMVCTTLNKFNVYKNLITNLFTIVHVIESLIFEIRPIV